MEKKSEKTGVTICKGIPKKRGRKAVSGRLEEQKPVRLPENFVEIEDKLREYGFATVVLDSSTAHLKRLWDGTRTLCLLCVKGDSSFRMDSTCCKIRENDSVVIDAGFILECLSVSEDFSAVALILAKSFLFSSAFRMPLDLHYHIQLNPVLSLSRQTADQLTGMFRLIQDKMSCCKKSDFFRQNIFNSRIVEQSARTFCYELFNQYGQRIPLRGNGNKMGTREMFILRFLDLLEQNVASKRHLQFYAEMLGITPQYLTTILKTLTGFSGNNWVHIVVCAKAKHLMLGQRKSPAMVAKELHYIDNLSFNRMFKNQTGYTPNRYQREVEPR